MSKTLEPKQVDRRLASRFIASGQLDETAYQKHITSLPDAAEKAAPVETTMDDEANSGEE
jgi:hypothetical protein